MKVYLIDGTYELFRAFYGAPSRKSIEGKEVGATTTLLRSLWALLKRPEVTHVACAFDHVIESFRNDLFSGYKTGEGVDPQLLSQFSLAEQATRALGIVTWPMIEFEADDALATAAARFAALSEVTQVVICSPDKDLAQCVQGTRVVLWDRLRDKLLDEASVVEKFGVAPASVPDLLALVGDAADGIPGIPGWGLKSAGRVLARYAHLEQIPASASDWDVPVRQSQKLARNLASNREDVLLFRELARLRLDVPLWESLDDLRYRGCQREGLEQLCRQTGDERFLERIADS